MRFLVGMLTSVMRTRRQRRNLQLLGWLLLAGTIFLLILLPFTFIQFFFTPWMEAQEAALLPRSLPSKTAGHVLPTRVGSVEEALVVTTQGDMVNTNVAFTVRETGATLPIVATASSDTAVDILEMAGCTRVLQLGTMLGEALARRVLGRDGRARVVGQFDDLVIAKAGVAGTDLAGRTLAAADHEVLERAGIRDCSAIVVTTHADVNVSLTLYCRRLRPDVQILARSTRERNVSTLHRAGADFVMSYATTGATAISNLLERVDILLVAEGLHVFRVDTPPSLAGRSLAESGIRNGTGCTVVAVGFADHFDPNPDALEPLAAGGELVLVGDAEAESRFIWRFGRGV
jgi:Trk K+ transport system NAD-binding subunit